MLLGSLGSAARRPGAGAIVSTGLSMWICSAVSGLSKNFNIVDPVHNSGVVLSNVALVRQLSSIDGYGSLFLPGISQFLFVELCVCVQSDKFRLCQVRTALSSWTHELYGVLWWCD